MCFQTDILPYLQNYELCIQHLKNLGLLPRSLNCPICKNRLFWTRYKKSQRWFWLEVSKWKLCEIQKYFFYSHGKFFCPKRYSVIKMVTFNLPTNLHLFVSISTFIHSIINILVKKPFSFWGGNS